MNDDVCRLIKLMTATGPAPVPLDPCCMAAVVAMCDRDRPDAVWLCPVEEGPVEEGPVEEGPVDGGPIDEGPLEEAERQSDGTGAP